MRRALVDGWPALSRLFGIHPWDVDRLTRPELAAYLAAHLKAIREGQV